MTAAGRIDATLAGLLRDLLGNGLALDEPLSRHTSMGTGGPADAFCRVGSGETLRALLVLLAGTGLPRLVLGRGTNILPSDAGFRGVVLALDGDFSRMVFDGNAAESGAAVTLAEFTEEAARHGLGGLEFTAGIPGSLGGSLIGNAGMAGEALGDLVERVDLMMDDGSIRGIPREQAGFAYRSSALAGAGTVVLGARFRLPARSRAEIAERVKSYAAKRREQPYDLRSAGCIFKNPAGHSAGQLIDQSGLKGVRAGAMEISDRHANFIVNRGGGTSAQAMELAELMARTVREKTGVVLEPEVRFIDEVGRFTAPGEGA
jgi:UDP-N-acetylmuramate dehydrogenase